jgi:hypothetical protein
MVYRKKILNSFEYIIIIFIKTKKLQKGLDVINKESIEAQLDKL